MSWESDMLWRNPFKSFEMKSPFKEAVPRKIQQK